MLSLTVLHSSKDVSSPIADEVMEEQADTEKTKTERTDHKREHASHTQHAMPAQGEASTSAVSLLGSCGIDSC